MGKKLIYRAVLQNVTKIVGYQIGDIVVDSNVCRIAPISGLPKVFKVSLTV